MAANQPNDQARIVVAKSKLDVILRVPPIAAAPLKIVVPDLVGIGIEHDSATTGAPLGSMVVLRLQHQDDPRNIIEVPFQIFQAPLAPICRHMDLGSANKILYDPEIVDRSG